MVSCSQGKIKKELKEWQRSFEVRVGRPATDADKSAIEDRFQAYQKVRCVFVCVALHELSLVVTSKRSAHAMLFVFFGVLCSNVRNGGIVLQVTRDVKEAARRQKDAEIALRALKERENTF